MDAFVLVVFGAIGAITGSFVGAFAERVYTGHSWLSGRSACNACARSLGPLDLVPIFSWLIALGRCRTCRAPVPALYTLLEVLLAILFAFAYVKLGFSLLLPIFLVACATLAFIIVYDLRHTIVPPFSSLLLAICALLYALSAYGVSVAFGEALMYAGAIGATFVALHVLSKGKAMGLGDAPIVFSLSVITYPAALIGLVFSFWIGGVIGIFILMLRRGGPKMGIEVPFVPFMAAGFLLAYFTTWNPFALIAP